MPDSLHVFPALLGFSVFLMGYLLTRKRFDADVWDLEDKELNSREIMVFTTIIFFGVLGGVAGYYLHWAAGFMAGFLIFIFVFLLSGYLGKLDKDIKVVEIDHSEGSSKGALFRMNEDYLYLATIEGVEILNTDSVNRVRDTQISYDGGTSLENWEGIHGGFNYIIRNREDYENIKELRVSLGNWLQNENFKGFEDKEIDVAIVYEYTDDGRALDLDNIVKPVISALEKDDRAEGGQWLVQDDSQIRQILAKSIERDNIGQENVPVERNENGDWREAHGRLTVSFREHSEKPMELVSGGKVM